MGLFDKVEKGLERTVNRAFAKAFKAEVAPVEIASAIRRAMDDRATQLGHGRTMVPNVYTIELAPSDFARYDEYSDSISQDLVAAAQEHAETQAYLPGGDIEVHFLEGADLDTGVFRLSPSTSKRASAGMPSASAGGVSAATGVPAAAGAAAANAAAGSASAAGPAGASAGPGPLPPAGIGMPPGPLPPAPAPDALLPDEVALPLPDRALAPDERPGPAAPPAAHAPAAHAPAPQPAPPARPAPPAPPVNPAQRPWLDIDGERYPLLGALTCVGRDATADIILDDPGISRRHSEIRVTHDGPHLVSSIRDLASTNGTFVNGERITSTHLQDGDRITIGRTAIVFRAGRR